MFVYGFIFLGNLKCKSDQNIVLASEDFTEETRAPRA